MRRLVQSKIVIALTILFLLLCISLAYYLFSPRHFVKSTQTYIFSPGTNSRQLADDLKRLNIITHPVLFRLALRLERVGTSLKGGEYHFPSGISVQKLINKLRDGDVVRYEVTIVDGWTFKQAMIVLENNPYLQHKLKGMSPEQIASKLHLKHKNPEGLFLPETYQFTWPDSDQEILQRAATALQAVLRAKWPTRETGLIYKTPYQALIAASLIQRESGNDPERPTISGVIYRRLVMRMRLQIDPTVIYALANRYKGKLTRKDMRVKSPYNTYLNYGLPPTPIALAGENSIQAALHPNDGDELYFVAKGDGTHHFSSTLKGQDKAIKKYLLKK